MIVSVDVSFYPLNENFEEPIYDFIKRISAYPMKVQTNGVSTLITGEYTQLMTALQKEIEKSIQIPHSVFVIKIVNSDRSNFTMK